MEKFEIKNILYKVNIKSRALSVMLYLVDRANKDLVCFPSIKTISKDLNISVSTTKRALNNLVEMDFIKKIERFLDTTGKQTSNLYVINIENIKKLLNVEKIEKVEEQEEKEILKVFKEPKEESNNKLKQEELKDNKTRKFTLRYRENNKNLTIINLVKSVFNFKFKDFKNRVLKKIKNILSMQFLFRNNELFISELEGGSFLHYL